MQFSRILHCNPLYYSIYSPLEGEVQLFCWITQIKLRQLFAVVSSSQPSFSVGTDQTSSTTYFSFTAPSPSSNTHVSLPTLLNLGPCTFISEPWLDEIVVKERTTGPLHLTLMSPPFLSCSVSSVFLFNQTPAQCSCLTKEKSSHFRSHLSVCRSRKLVLQYIPDSRGGQTFLDP